MISPISFGSNMDIYNDYYKNLRHDQKVDFENFNGRRTIKIYRGDTFLNRITEKLDPKKPWFFIRYMLNKGTKKEPNLVDTSYSFRGPGGNLIVHLNEPNGIERKGVTLHVHRLGFDTFKKQFDSLSDMRSSKIFQEKLKQVLNKPDKNVIKYLL